MPAINYSSFFLFRELYDLLSRIIEHVNSDHVIQASMGLLSDSEEENTDARMYGASNDN